MDIIVQGHTFHVIEKNVTSKAGDSYAYLRTFVSVGKYPSTGRVRQVEVAGRTVAELERRIVNLLHFSHEEAGVHRTVMNLDEWFDEVDRYRETAVEEQTSRAQRSAYHIHIQPHMGKMPIAEIDEEVLIEWQEERLASGVRNNRIRTAFGVISMCLEMAVRRRYLTYNPCRYSLIVPEENNTRQALANNVIRTLLVDHARHEYIPLIAVTLLCALRIGEVIALTWEDLDTDKRMLTIRRQAVLRKDTDGNAVIRSYTKNKRPRRICIPASALWYLNMQRQAQHQMASEDPEYSNPYHLIFTDDKGNTLDRDKVSRWYHDILFYTAPAATMHDLRRTGVSRAVELTHDINGARIYLGHASNSTTYRYLCGDTDAPKRIASLMDPYMKYMLMKSGYYQRR